MKIIQEIIQNLGQTGRFSEIVLTDASGFPLAAYSQSGSPDAIAAVSATIQRSAGQAGSRIGLQTMQEITLFDETGQRLVCRRFTAGDHTLFLSLRLQQSLAYRRVVSQAIRQIQAAWNTNLPGKE